MRFATSSRMVRRRLGLAVVAVLLSLLIGGPSLARAAVTLGPTDIAAAPDGLTGCGASPCTLANTGGTGLAIAAPFDGVLVRWRIRTATATAEWQLRVVRQVMPGLSTGAGSSSAETVEPGAERVFATRLPISAGDLIGVNGPASATAPLAFRTNAGGGNNRWNPPLADGESPGRSPNGFGGGFVGLYNADLEPDADGDSFGDETQDCAPNDASRHDDCVAPETTITERPKDKTKKKTATFEFTGTDAGGVASFQCKLDAGAFAPCTSPHTVKVRKGKHSFQVEAIDQAGNVSAPATDDWKVKKKKKK